MRSLTLCCLVVVLLVSFALAQTESKTSSAMPVVIPAFDKNAIDTSADPCADFFQYACGAWNKNNPLPGDQARWGRFDQLAEHNQIVLRAILENAAAPDSKRTPIAQQVGDYYSACMDEKAAETRGASALAPMMKRIDGIKNSKALLEEISYLHRQGISALFAFYPLQDFHDSKMMIGNADQGGLGMPDRDYYRKEDTKSAEIRAQYLAHVQKMMELAGEKPPEAAEDAKVVMKIETALAKAAMDRTARRDPRNRDHRMSTQELAALAPAFDFPFYLPSTGAEIQGGLNVGNPGFFKEVNPMLDDIPLPEWKSYLRWRVVRATAPMLAKAFVDEDYRFNEQVLRGQKEQRPRWKRCVVFTDEDLGEASGELYVERTFGAEGKQRTLAMVEALENALRQDIQTLPWMTDATRQQALIKLAAIRNKIGYPDKWRDYSKLTITRDDALANFLHAHAFEVHRQVAKIGHPVDRAEWNMTPPTVNAYYSPPRNEIVFPAGILQPPFYANRADDAVNFGGIGSVIGHELTHGFDDQGRKYDADGNLRDWWTPEDARAFEERAGCIADEYSGFTAVGDVKLNGRLTLGENTADNGGVRIAYAALMDKIAGKDLPNIDGYRPEQRFFLSFAQIWCQNTSPEEARRRVIIDPHSPGRWRVNGVLQNNSDFAKAFGCKAGQAMVREKACRVW
ncbi:MAG TPA: M13 family metallopeptidase [Terriglobales bacterium]|nr:M13 family metallopeptidase [Terriglobales bacterium]